MKFVCAFLLSALLLLCTASAASTSVAAAKPFLGKYREPSKKAFILRSNPAASSDPQHALRFYQPMTLTIAKDAKISGTATVTGRSLAGAATSKPKSVRFSGRISNFTKVGSMWYAKLTITGKDGAKVIGRAIYQPAANGAKESVILQLAMTCRPDFGGRTTFARYTRYTRYTQ